VSVWLVNQLYTRERARFDQLFASGAALRNGDRASAASHRDTLAALRESALALLAESGRPVQDAVIRRVMTTLSTLAANGSFDPDLAGALESDREAVGFGVAVTFPKVAVVEPLEESDNFAEPEPQVDEVERERKRAAAAAARERDQARARRDAERTRLELVLNGSEALAQKCEGEVARLRAELERAERELSSARASACDVAARLEALHAANDD
jgi:hypothetical protein